MDLQGQGRRDRGRPSTPRAVSGAHRLDLELAQWYAGAELMTSAGKLSGNGVGFSFFFSLPTLMARNQNLMSDAAGFPHSLGEPIRPQKHGPLGRTRRTRGLGGCCLHIKRLPSIPTFIGTSGLTPHLTQVANIPRAKPSYRFISL